MTFTWCLVLLTALAWTNSAVVSLAGSDWIPQYPEAEFRNLLANDTQRLLSETQLDAKETLHLLSRTVNLDGRLVGDYTIRDALNLNKVSPEFCASVLLKIRLQFCRLLMALPGGDEAKQEATQLRNNVIYWCRKSLEDFVASHCNRSALKCNPGEPQFIELLVETWSDFSHKNRNTSGGAHFGDLLASEMTDFEQFILNYP